MPSPAVVRFTEMERLTLVMIGRVLLPVSRLQKHSDGVAMKM